MLDTDRYIVFGTLSGTFVQVGMGAPNLVIPMYLVAGKELGIFGSFR